MKNLVLVLVFLWFTYFVFGEVHQTQSNGKVFQIHKSKRVFVDKKDRPYLQSKDIEQSKQNPSGRKQKNKKNN